MNTEGESERPFNEREPRPPVWRWIAESDSDEIRGLPDGFDLETEPFEGAWFYREACERGDDAAMVVAVGRIVFMRLATDAVRRQMRGEDLQEGVAAALDYVIPLELDRTELRLLRRLAGSLVPFDPAAAADALLALSWSALRHDWMLSSRCFAELAYETGRSYGADSCAEGAARALARLAILEESPRAARRWRGRAAVLARRGHRHRSARA